MIADDVTAVQLYSRASSMEYDMNNWDLIVLQFAQTSIWLVVQLNCGYDKQ